jgi:Mrp family chromosome partitioning ATPase
MQQYLQVFLKGIKRKDRPVTKSFVVAFTSYLPEEGVSYVTQSFAMEVSKRTGKRTLIADAERLSQVEVMAYGDISHFCFETDVPNLWNLPADDENGGIDADGSMYLQAYAATPTETLFNNLKSLGYVFDYILLDCPALSESDDMAFLVPETDGVMVVVEADRTRRDQIENAREMIERADGNLLGFILNKRRYTVPGWIYNRL